MDKALRNIPEDLFEKWDGGGHQSADKEEMATPTLMDSTLADNAHRITVEIKNIYGDNLAYPKCSKAAAFASIAGTATLTPRVLRLIQSMGYEIIQLSATLEI